MVILTMSQSLASSLPFAAVNGRKKTTNAEPVSSSPATTTTVFQSNLSCVLNDPKKTRAELASFFTKTWGSSFVDRPPDPLVRLGDYSLSDFESYFVSLRKSDKYGRPHLPQQQQQQTSSDTTVSVKTTSTINIPQLFLSSQFSLSDTNTFNLVFPGIVALRRPMSPSSNDQHTSRTTSTSSEKSESTSRRPSSSSGVGSKSTSNGAVNNGPVSTASSPKHSITSNCRLLQDKYTHYLDEVEVLISRALATKSNGFHDAVRSHDEIQLFLATTRRAISALRAELSTYDSQSLLNLLRLYRFLRQRQHQRQLLKRLEYLAIVKQTHIQVRALLTTSDYLSALDLISVTREIVSTQLNDLVCLRYSDAQLSELHLLIVNMMRQEFGQCLNNELLAQQEDPVSSSDFIDEDKFVTILIGLIRVRDDKFMDEIRAKFEQFMSGIIERSISKDVHTEKTLVRTTVKTNSESVDEPSTTPRYTFPSSITSASGSHSSDFSSWLRSITQLLSSIQHGFVRLTTLSHLISDVLSKQQTNIPSIISLVHTVHDTIQDRLIAVFTQECARYQVHLERLPIDEYAQMVKLIENYIHNVSLDENKYNSRPLKTWLQGQTSKFLAHFHDERKQRMATTLDNEQWKQVPIPRSIQTSVDDLLGSSSSLSSSSSASSNAAGSATTLVIDNEHFIVPNCALHMFMLVLDYCSCAQLLAATSVSDVQNRLIELLNIFNSKTCQLVLGAGAVKLGKIKTITAKILAITCRCLQFIKVALPKIKMHFDQLQASSDYTSTILSVSSAKQFEQLMKLYSDHIGEIHSKLISIIESTFDDTLSSYEVRAPMPSDCFRTLVTRHIAAFYNAVARIVSASDLILLFTRLNSIFKHLLAKRLRQLKIANDGGPQHGLLTSDLLYYIKQVQSLPGLEMLELHVDEIWTTS